MVMKPFHMKKRDISTDDMVVTNPVVSTMSTTGDSLTNEKLSYISILDVIESDSFLENYFNSIGIYFKNSKASSIYKNFIYSSLFIVAFGSIIASVVQISILPGSLENNFFAVIIFASGVLYIFLIFSLFSLQRKFIERNIPKEKLSLFIQGYKEAIQSYCYALLCLFQIILIFLVLFGIASSNSVSRTRLPIFIVNTILIALNLVGNIPLIGIYIHYFAYQKIIGLLIKEVAGKLESDRFINLKYTDQQYLMDWTFIDSINHNLGMNLIFFITLCETIILLLFILFLPALNYGFQAAMYTDPIYAGSILLKDFASIFIILYESIKVNEIADEIEKKFITNLIPFTEDIQNDNYVHIRSKIQRVELLLIMKSYKLGWKIFNVLPTRFQLFIQLLSLVGMLCLTTLKIIITQVVGWQY